MSIELIASHLRIVTGFDSASVGVPMVEQAVSLRMLECHVSSHVEYYELLTASKNELNLLIDQVMIPETWFFRGYETFNFLRELLATRSVEAQEKKLKILSIPCATGEEPYSIGMILYECKYTLDEFRIEAIDISQKSLRQANNAVFTEHSFREVNDHIKQQYFKKMDVGYKLCDYIKNTVTFSNKNILDMQLNANDKYDIVFCRNLLIYFNREARHSVLNKIDSLMMDNGVLFIGPGEAGCMANSQFIKVDRPSVFAFTKKAHGAMLDCAKNTINSINDNVNCIFNGRKLTAKNKNTKIQMSGDDCIDEAIKLADQGKLDEAIIKCRESIQIDGVSEDTLCLLGVINDAKGDRKEASRYYKRALHLAPNHQQSLIHLASHAERDGDEIRAIEYRTKAMHNSKQLT